MRFFPKYKRDSEVLEAMLAKGEHDTQDFKLSVPALDKIARTLAAFANGSGGRLLIGVNDTAAPVGTDTEEAMHLLFDAAENYCDPPVDLKFIVHEIDDVEILEAQVLKSLKRPHAAPDEKGHWQIYVRKGDQTLLATVKSKHPFSREDRSRLIGWVKQHRSITKAEAAELLKCKPEEAAEILEQMVAEGIFVSSVARRGAYKLR